MHHFIVKLQPSAYNCCFFFNSEFQFISQLRCSYLTCLNVERLNKAVSMSLLLLLLLLPNLHSYNPDYKEKKFCTYTGKHSVLFPNCWDRAQVQDWTSYLRFSYISLMFLIWVGIALFLHQPLVVLASPWKWNNYSHHFRLLLQDPT